MEYLERPTKSATDGILLDRLSGTWGTSETKKMRRPWVITMNKQIIDLSHMNEFELDMFGKLNWLNIAIN